MTLRNSLRQDPPRKRAASLAERHSNGLKDFLWLLADAPRGRILDLGAVSQQTIDFFTERGFRVSTEDLLHEWLACRAEAEAAARKEAEVAARKEKAEPAKLDLAALAGKFLEANLVFPGQSFVGILAWDLFDYLEAEISATVLARLHALLAPRGVLLAAFHSSRTDKFHHYRVLDQETIELLASAPATPLRRVLQNREILNLFARFQSSRTYVGRDQLREALFIK